MYKDDAYCTVAKDQVQIMKNAGWSLTKSEPKVIKSVKDSKPVKESKPTRKTTRKTVKAPEAV